MKCILAFLLEKSNAPNVNAIAAYAARLMLLDPEPMIVNVGRYHRLAIAMVSSNNLPLMA